MILCCRLVIENPKELDRRSSVRKPVKTDSYSCLDKLIFFYNAPVITFMHNCVSFTECQTVVTNLHMRPSNLHKNQMWFPVNS